jgi:hypothetical protein
VAVEDAVVVIILDIFVAVLVSAFVIFLLNKIYARNKR